MKLSKGKKLPEKALMKNPEKISSIIIAKNAGDTIGDYIDSLKKCTDEIIVIVDKSSSDNTLDVVKSQNVTYETREWIGYSAAKKYALSKTSFNYILWIDADEVLTDELIDELNQMKEEGLSLPAYKVARRAFFLGKWIKHSGWYPGYVTRLFDKRKARFSDNDVHEHLRVDGETGKLLNDINHFTDPDIHHYFTNLICIQPLPRRK